MSSSEHQFIASSLHAQSLRKQLVPSDPANLSYRDERAIRNAINALHYLSDEIKRIIDRKVYRLTLPQQLWEEGLLDWLWFLRDHYHPSPNGRWEAISYITCILAYFTKVNVYLMFDKLCFCLAGQLWLDREYDHLRSEYSSTHGFWEPFLYFIFGGTMSVPQGPRQKDAADFLFHALNGGLTIDLLLKRIQTSVSLMKSSDKEYSFLTGRLSHLLPLYSVSEPFPEFQGHIITTIADVVHDILSRILPARFSHAMLEACFNLTFALTKRLEIVNSIDMVRLAIKHKIVESVAMFCKYFDYMSRYFGFAKDNLEIIFQYMILTVLTDIVPKYMWYPSVQKTLCSVMANSDKYDKEVRGTRGEDRWKFLCDLYEKSVFATNESPIPRISLCDNLTHGTSVVPTKLYRCSGCRSTWYCSTRCQKPDWDNGHRISCKNTKDAFPPGMILRRRDYISVIRFAIAEVIEEYDKSTKNTITSQNIPPEHLLVADYTCQAGALPEL